MTNLSSMFSQFETDPVLETDGIWIDYGDYRVQISRAGGANKKYLSYAETKTKPFRRAIQAGTMSENRIRDLLYDVYAKTVILNWQVADGEMPNGETKWKNGIPAKEVGAAALPVTPENIIATFRMLPSLFTDLQQAAEGIALFRKEEMEADAKN
jgi:hypothetical protein